jgi:hypothetical protein
VGTADRTDGHRARKDDDDNTRSNRCSPAATAATCTPAPTEVELTFTSLGPALTRVAVEHRGWDALSRDQLSEDCAIPGGYTSGAYRDGWATILRHFATAAQPDHTECHS